MERFSSPHELFRAIIFSSCFCIIIIMVVVIVVVIVVVVIIIGAFLSAVARRFCGQPTADQLTD